MPGRGWTRPPELEGCLSRPKSPIFQLEGGSVCADCKGHWAGTGLVSTVLSLQPPMLPQSLALQVH